MIGSRVPLIGLRPSFSVVRKSRNALVGAVVMWIAFWLSPAGAGQPEVSFVELENQGSTWAAHVTVRHADTGWEHYADAWRILDAQGAVLGTRTLYHPHEDEQPFTRSLSGIRIPSHLKEIDVQAHDKVHGWGAKVRVQLSPGEGDRHRVR